MVIHPLWLTSSPWILLILIKLIFVVHFCFEAHFLPQNFSNDSRNSLKMSDVLYVPGLKGNIVSTSALEDKGYRVAFIDGKVLIWHKTSSLDSASVIGVWCDSLYRLTGRLVHALVHDDTHLSELWHRRFSHLHYRALPSVRKMVTGFPEF